MIDAELADLRYGLAMSRYGAALIADDIAAASVALVEAFQQLDRFNDDLTVWSAIRAAMPSSAWNPN